MKLAEAAGVDVFTLAGKTIGEPYVDATFKQLTKLIALAKQSAYEDAAKLCDLMPSANCYGIAEAIRNRANEVTK